MKPWWRRWFGTRSERAAVRFLRRLGYRILARNYSCPHGELDLVALDRDCVVIVEVRSTERADLTRPARFDVLALSWPAGRREPAVAHYPHAFEAVGRFQMYH